MPNFIVRFQLDNATNNDYLKLKRLLIPAGFTKEIKADNGTPYILPQGTYLASTEKDKNHVLEVAINVVRRLQLRYKILVTESAGSAWINLDPA